MVKKEKPTVTHHENAVSTPDDDHIQELGDEILAGDRELDDISPEQREKVGLKYGMKAEEHEIAPRKDVEYMIGKITSMTEEDAMEILVNAIDFHSDDPNFPSDTMAKIKLLVQGPKVYGAEPDDFDFDLKTEAAIIRYHSPYPEVRAVAGPYDDPTIPVETFRAYALGLIWMSASTVVNTFFSPRQPAITITAVVLQLLLAPCGLFCAKFLPDWGFTIRGKRFTLNPGPWSFKEQMFATIMFSIASGPGGTYYVYLVQRLPRYLGNEWVKFPYEICLALSIQFFGFSFAGIMRRFVIYPVKSIWPKTFPTLALNHALVVKEKKEVINGWKMSRYRFFMLCFAAMFLYFWIPNYLFQALRSFNWMTWISPQNFTLAMVTGFYGGLGYNPIATLDWNVAGTNALVTPFFSTFQQYIARFLSGLVMIGMYWGNYVWAAYTPINSNEAFDNKGNVYNVTAVLTDGHLDIEKYKTMGPPYFSGANVFGQGAWFAWYAMVLTYVCINQWTLIKAAFTNIYRGFRYKEHFSKNEKDPHTEMMSQYKEAPDWWFGVVLLVSLALGIVALRVWPTQTPVWSIFAIIGMSAVLIIPAALLLSVANVSLGFNVLFQLLGGLWFPGNPEASIIVTAFGSNFDSQTDNFLSDQKLGHYAKLPPRAVFRGQMVAVFINCFIFIGFLDWMVENFQTETLCTWADPNHFVCTNAVLVFASAVEYGAFGVRNMFELYPIMPWCFLMGGVVGIVFAVAHKYGYLAREYFYRNCSEERFEKLDNGVFKWFAKLKTFNPAVFWAGALNWSGGNNLSYATNALYLSFIFMYYIKRRYTSWFQKYNYLLESGFDVGVAVSGIIQTFAFQFGDNPINIDWWGNTVATAGIDYVAYNQNATLLPVPEIGYFGLPPEKYPMHF